jgi:lysozyme family protein
MTKSFEKAFEMVIGHEGGYVDDPTDRGGETKYGITKKYYPEEDIKNLTLTRAKEIYYDNYWKHKKLDLDKLADFHEKLAIELFDTGVNQGIVTSAKYLQESLNLLNRNEKLFDDMKVDGWAGNTTFGCLYKLRSYDKPALLKCVNGLQFMRYYDIVEDDPTQEKFFSGWMKRV